MVLRFTKKSEKPKISTSPSPKPFCGTTVRPRFMALLNDPPKNFSAYSSWSWTHPVRFSPAMYVISPPAQTISTPSSSDPLGNAYVVTENENRIAIVPFEDLPVLDDIEFMLE